MSVSNLFLTSVKGKRIKELTDSLHPNSLGMEQTTFVLAHWRGRQGGSVYPFLSFMHNILINKSTFSAVQMLKKWYFIQSLK